MTPSTPHVSRVPAFFASAFAWNLALGMTHILIPLYADHLGFSGVAIGSLVSLPVLVQIGFNLLGGVWTDRVGGKRLGWCPPRCSASPAWCSRSHRRSPRSSPRSSA